MGNILPRPLPCMCKEARVVHATVAAGAKKLKRKKRSPAAKNVVVCSSDQDGGEEDGMEKRAAWPGCRVQELTPADEDGGVRLKVVMTRKDAAEFMARLEERAAAERKSRMGYLKRRISTGGAGGVTSPCRDAWRPRLATIQENC